MQNQPARPPSSGMATDLLVRAGLARMTGSLSVASGVLAATDWGMNLLVLPGKQFELGLLALDHAGRLARYAGAAWLPGSDPLQAGGEQLPRDHRFESEEWRRWPYNVLRQSLHLTEQWWTSATTGVLGVERHHEQLVSFAVRQWLDLASPGNVLATNPVALRRTLDEGGLNLVRGTLNLANDLRRLAAQMPPPGADDFGIGRDLAATPGKVVMRNRLMELIQYTPTTPRVRPEPVLLVPAWIMKYYILDLSPANSLVKYLVDQGHTVYCISWKNPQAEDRDLRVADYVQLGVGAALDAMGQIAPGRKVHALGYCLGGTLLAAVAAAMARDRDDRLASLTLLAAQTDFSEPGELGVFIDEAQVSLLEAQMAETGYLSARQMAGAFHMLRSNDLLWSRIVNHYMLGQPEAMSDLMAWNADATRMPARMHSEYLRAFFLHDDLAQNRYRVGGRPVSLSDIKLPVFLVGTSTDHVAPWRSVYKLHYLSSAEITFALTNGGHNAGIVNPPGHVHRHYQMLTLPAGATRLDPDRWLAEAPDCQGSWWPAWHEWLDRHSGSPVKPPRMGLPKQAPVADAPGHYVLDK